jgi:nuclear GTP-binding protein
VCNVAPIPGETKVWQYITLMRRIYLIDCPGIVPPNQHDTPQDILLRGVVRVENVENPEQYIPAVLAKVKRHHMERTYELKGWEDHIQFLELLARKGGRLHKGGEPDVDGVAKMVLNDFMRGKIPWFTPPPETEEEEGVVRDGREGKLGEMPMKRKRDDAESMPDTSMGASTPKTEATTEETEDSKSADGESEFEGFGDGAEREDSAPDISDEDSDDSDMISLGFSDDNEEDSERGGEDSDGAAPDSENKEVSNEDAASGAGLDVISQGGSRRKRPRR